MSWLSGSGVLLTIGDRVSNSTVEVVIQECGTHAILHVEQEWIPFLTVGAFCTIRDFGISWKDDQVHFFAFIVKQASIFLHPGSSRGEIVAAEVFGGMAGWSNAGHYAGWKIPFVVERDEQTARACGKTLQVDVFTTSEFMEQILSGQAPPKAVVIGDVTQGCIWMAFGLANIGHVFGSPPCQPWSGAGLGRGLFSPDGDAFSKTLEWGGVLRVHTITLENVPGFIHHVDYHTVVARAAAGGLRLIIGGVYGCHQVLPVHRDRWIGIFVHSDVQFRQDTTNFARAVSFIHPSLSKVVNHPTVGSSGCLHVNASDRELGELQIPEKLHELMQDIDFAPGWLKEKMQQQSPHDDVFTHRIIKPSGQVTAIMACYGHQHDIPEEQLRARGLQTIVFGDGDFTRLFSPWEFVACLGYPSSTVLCDDLTIAWRMAGNGLSVAHGWLAMHKLNLLLGPLVTDADGVAIDQIQSFQQAITQMCKFESIREGGFCFLVERLDLPEPEPKRPRIEGVISPTLLFNAVDREPDSLTTHPFADLPGFDHSHDCRVIAFGNVGCGGGIVMVKHVQKNWVSVVNCSRDTTVRDVICKVLPHAKESQFVTFMIGDVVVEWHDSIRCVPMKSLVFDPQTISIVCMHPNDGKQIPLTIDVTWQVSTVISYVAVHLGCNPSVLALVHQQLALKPDDFVIELGMRTFQLSFRTVLPGFVAFESQCSQIQDPGMCPIISDMRRVFARHPSRKVVRTIAASKQHLIFEIVNCLFPDVSSTCTWTVFCDGQVVDDNHVFDHACHYQIQWDGLRPLPVTDLYTIRCMHAVDSPFFQNTVLGFDKDVKKMWIRSPFRVKASLLKLPVDAMLGEIASSFLSISQVQGSLLCEIGTVVVDPLTKVDSLGDESVISFRICPLLGGARGDAVRPRVKKCLSDRGVPTKVLDERVQGFLAKIKLDRLTAVKDESDVEFWKVMKELANEVKFRLIQTDELKSWQHSKRQVKPPAKRAFPKDSSSSTNHSTHQVVAKDLVVDMTHFRDGESKPSLLEPSRFGPDQKGITVATADDARRIMQSTIRSSDGLALLVIDNDMQGFDCVFNLPAHLKDHTPVIVRACLINFGDKEIVFKADLPELHVSPVASTTVEFTIFRDLTTSWDDVNVPLHFLGVKVPPLRGSNLISTWSIRAWNKNRKSVSHPDATHWHGYIRISDSILNAVLNRSGYSGIFFCPKGSDKKPDTRFATVALPLQDLSEIQAKVEKCSNALGIAKLGDRFAVRCRREFVDAVRSSLLPETAFVATPAIDTDDQLYLIKNVPGELGREGLTEALVNMGWKANAIRAQGVDRWVIASKDPPPQSHLVVNGGLSVIEPMQKTKNTIPVTMVAREFQVQATVDASNQVTAVSTSSRFAEVRAELEAQVSEAMESRLASANARIDALTTALNEHKAEQQKTQQAFKEEQQFTRQKVAEIETTVTASGQMLLNQMQNMFSTMQQKLETSISTQIADVKMGLDGEAGDKRQRVDDPKVPKNDPFASKA